LEVTIEQLQAQLQSMQDEEAYSELGGPQRAALDALRNELHRLMERRQVRRVPGDWCLEGAASAGSQ
jgi:hypothetical protein